MGKRQNLASICKKTPNNKKQMSNKFQLLKIQFSKHFGY